MARGDKRNRYEKSFVSYVANVVYHVVCMERRKWTESTKGLLRDIAHSRKSVAKLLEDEVGRRPNLEELFRDGCRQGFDAFADIETSGDYERRELVAELEASSDYSFEHIVAFDPRPRRRGGRAMEKPDRLTLPPAAARAINELDRKRDEHHPVLDDPGRMASDADGTEYTRMLRHGRLAKQALPEFRDRLPDQPGIRCGSPNTLAEEHGRLTPSPLLDCVQVGPTMPPATTEETTRAGISQDDQYAWLEGQCRAIKDVQAGRGSFESLDLEGLEDELRFMQFEIRDRFERHASDIVERLVLIQTQADTPEELRQLMRGAKGSRFELSRLMKENPSLEAERASLFEDGRSLGIECATIALGLVPSSERYKTVERACQYSFEQAVAFDSRPAATRTDGTLAGRGMDGLPDSDTWPPDVARKLNAGIKDLRRPFPILDDPGRMAEDDPTVRYERMAESGRDAKRPEAMERSATPPPSQPGIQPGGLAAQTAPDRDR